jgi:hypothetical protein
MFKKNDFIRLIKKLMIDKEFKMRNLRIVFLLLFFSSLFFSFAFGKSKQVELFSKHIDNKTIAPKPLGSMAKPAFQSFGGPNSYGYTWLDSDTTGGPTYNWIEIDTIGTKVQFTEWTSPETWPADDGTAGPFPLGFQFVYHGTTYDSIYIGTNGLLSFSESDLTRDGYFHTGMIPYLRFPDVLAPFYNDLNLDTTAGSYGGGYVYYWTNSVDSFIVEYKNVKPYVYPSTIDTLNFQVILVETDSSITYQYKTVATPNSGVLGTPVRADSSALIGIQDHSRYFGLRYFDGESGGYENLPQTGLAVQFKRTSNFVHNVVPRREIIYYLPDNPYNYPPYYLFYANEVGDTLSENSVVVFNTGGSQENDVPVVCKIYKRDNLGGYSLEDSSYNTISSLPAGDTARVDFSGSWAPDQRGTYLVTYYTTLQTDDLPSDDTTSGCLFAEKNDLSCPWANSIPTCNGILEAGEWSDACTLDISKFAVPQPTFELRVIVGPNFYESDGTILYAKNDSSYLYLAFDLLADTSDTEADWISIDIDDNGNRFFDQDSSDGQLSLWNDFIGGFDAMFFWPLISAALDSFASFGNVEAVSGWEFGMQYNGDHMQAEVRIPFGNNPKRYLNSGPGNSIGIWIGIADAGDPYLDDGELYANQIAYWPWQGIFSYFPQKLARIHLSSSSTSIEEDGSEGSIANAFKLDQNYPNPFNPTTVINYELPRPAKVKLNVYNVLGQRIKTLANGLRAAGNHTVVWDGKDQKGRRVASGIYFYKIAAGDYTCVRKMILLR